MQIVQIKKGDTIYALLLRKDISMFRAGVYFVTDPGDPLQVALSYYEQGHIIKAHRHLDRNRYITHTYEVIHLEEGSSVVRIFDENYAPVSTIRLMPGDTVIFMRGYHSLEFDRNSIVIEVKQGPYPGKDQDKEYMS